jgi:hypothetical protein
MMRDKKNVVSSTSYGLSLTVPETVSPPCNATQECNYIPIQDGPLSKMLATPLRQRTWHQSQVRFFIRKLHLYCQLTKITHYNQFN